MARTWPPRCGSPPTRACTPSPCNGSPTSSTARSAPSTRTSPRRARWWRRSRARRSSGSPPATRRARGHELAGADAPHPRGRRRPVLDRHRPQLPAGDAAAPAADVRTASRRSPTTTSLASLPAAMAPPRDRPRRHRAARTPVPRPSDAVGSHHHARRRAQRRPAGRPPGAHRRRSCSTASGWRRPCSTTSSSAGAPISAPSPPPMPTSTPSPREVRWPVPFRSPT